MTFIIPAILISIAAAGVLAGYISGQAQPEQEDAEATVRAIAHRGRVTAPIPFAKSTATVNAPGLVEVQPLSRSTTHSPAPLPRSASVASPLQQPPTTASATQQLPIEIAEAANDAEAEIIVSRWEGGESMTKTIFQVWGIRAGGSKAYKAARDRYKSYLSNLEA